MTDIIPMEITEGPGVEVLLCRRLTSDEAVKLHETLVESRGCVHSINASSVEFLGAAGLQVLLSAVKSARRDQKALHIVDPSQGFLAGLDRLGGEIGDLTTDEAAPCP